MACLRREEGVSSRGIDRQPATREEGAGGVGGDPTGIENRGRLRRRDCRVQKDFSLSTWVEA